MILGYARGDQLHQQIHELDRYGVDELFCDKNERLEIFTDTNSDFQQLLGYAQSGDTIVLPTLSILSRDYATLMAFTKGLDCQQVNLIVLNLPFESTNDIHSMLRWVVRNDRFLHPKLIHFGKHTEMQHGGISKDPEVKKLVRTISSMLLRKVKLKEIASVTGVPIETVFQVKKEIDKVKLVLFLLVVFFATVAGIKIAEQFTESFWLQIIVCLAASGLIVWNTLSDSELD